jgi:hypothetical protein
MNRNGGRPTAGEIPCHDCGPPDCPPAVHVNSLSNSGDDEAYVNKSLATYAIILAIGLFIAAFEGARAWFSPDNYTKMLSAAFSLLAAVACFAAIKSMRWVLTGRRLASLVCTSPLPGTGEISFSSPEALNRIRILVFPSIPSEFLKGVVTICDASNAIIAKGNLRARPPFSIATMLGRPRDASMRNETSNCEDTSILTFMLTRMIKKEEVLKIAAVAEYIGTSRVRRTPKAVAYEIVIRS